METQTFSLQLLEVSNTLLQGKSFLLGAFFAYFIKDSDRVGNPFDSSCGDLVDVVCSAGLGIQPGPPLLPAHKLQSALDSKRRAHIVSFWKCSKECCRANCSHPFPHLSYFVLAWGPSAETLHFILSAEPHRRVKPEFCLRLDFLWSH